jgi:hypothetical protein
MLSKENFKENLNFFFFLKKNIYIQGFAYAHRKNPRDISAHDEWQDYSGRFKTPTVLKYDRSLKLESWGFPALAERPNRRENSPDIKPVERFKLHLGKMTDKPHLPVGLDYTTAITDYLREMGEVIKETMKTRWKIDKENDFFRQVFIVMTVKSLYVQLIFNIFIVLVDSEVILFVYAIYTVDSSRIR